MFCVFSFLFFGFCLFRFWLLGFLAFWLLGFWTFRLVVGSCGFWWLFGFGFSHPLLSQVPLLAFWLLHPLVFGFCFPHHQHHQFRPI